MPVISLIAAIDENYGLGKDNQLLCHLPADLAHFKKITLGKPIIMGRKTFDSIGKPLPGRTNIVLSHSQNAIPGIELVHNLKQALECAVTAEEIMIIGGAQLFQETLPLASRLYLTVIHHQFDADVFFPRFDQKAWRCCQQVFKPADEKNAYAMTFTYYERINE